MVYDVLLVRFAHPHITWRLRQADSEGYHQRRGYVSYADPSQRQSFITYVTALCIMRYGGASTAYLGRVLDP